MIKLIKARTPFLALILSLLAIGHTFAANRVVVVPMLGSDTAQWALVGDNQTILDQSGGISVADTDTGVVYLDFGKRVVGRPIIATPQLYGGVGFFQTAICGAGPSEIDANCGLSKHDGNHVVVRTFQINGAFASHAFYIVIP